MRKKPDRLIEILNKVSNSNLWPTYFISKDTSKPKVQSPISLDNQISKKIKIVLEKRLNDKRFSSEKKNKSAKTYKRPNNSILPLVITRKTFGKEFFNYEHLKVLKMVPSIDKKNEKSYRSTAQPLIKRDLKLFAGFTPKTKIRKDYLVHSIETQTNISEEESFLTKKPLMIID